MLKGSFYRRTLGLVLLVVALLLSGAGLIAAGRVVSSVPAAAASMRSQPVQPTPTAQTGPERFPISETMTDTVRAVLESYHQAMLDPRQAAAGPVEIASSPVIIYLPSSMNKLPVATPRPPVPTPTPSPTPRPAKPADVAVTIWPNPSIRVARDGTLAYEIRIKNYGKGGADRAHVVLPHNKYQLVVTGSDLDSDAGDWVSQVRDDQVTVTFGPVSPNEYRTGTIYFHVNKALPDNMVISMRAVYDWSDERDGGNGMTNWAPVLVGAGNDSAPWVWLAVDPLSGPAGTTHHFFTDRFIPGEGIYTWLNTPGGVKPLDLRGVADTTGRVWLDFKSSGLRPGMYSLVLYGARSNLTAVATFYVL